MPILSAADPARMGISFPSKTAFFKAGLISPCDNSPFSRYFSISLSSHSATFSTRDSESLLALVLSSPSSWSRFSFVNKLTVPLKEDSFPIGYVKNAHLLPSLFIRASAHFVKSACSLSILFTKIMAGTLFCSSMENALFVPISMPPTALTRITAPSTALKPLMASPIKSPYPGTSMRLIFVPSFVKCNKEELIDILRSFSSSL